jgi:signal transduction histidine kinase
MRHSVACFKDVIMNAHGLQCDMEPALAGTGIRQSLQASALALAGLRRAALSDATLDQALRLGLLAWMTHFLVSMGQGFSTGMPQAAGAAHLGIQVLILSVAFFLIHAAGMASSGIYGLLGTQALAGTAALFYGSEGNEGQVPGVCVVLNMLSAMLLVIAIAARAYLPRSYPGWLALAGSLGGLLLCIERMLLAQPTDNAAVLSRYGCIFLLLLVWQLLTQRARRPPPRRRRGGLLQHPGSPHEQVIAASAVDHERRRIAMDLHDGVASQIVSILSSLDHHAPEQQALGLALEQCLLDIKITVDSIESGDQDILQALGALRYRIQRPLDKLGIRMVWEVDMCSALETVEGPEAQQVLRIAQECLSNVMRHARATMVVVTCRYVAEVDCMQFEVRDNGVGSTPDPARGPTGRGLDNMRQRARQIGGELTVSSQPGVGTWVVLKLPLDPGLGALPFGSGDA